MTQQS